MKHNHIHKYVIALALCALASVARAGDTLRKDMVQFDQAYIPVLALTTAGDVRGSRAAFDTLDQVWRGFNQRYYSEQPDDPLWKKDFDQVNSYIVAAGKIIQRGKEITRAHEELEHVRVVFMELRKRHGIDYFIDHLTRFHQPMEDIVLAVKGKTVSNLSGKDLGIVRHTLPKAMELWQLTSSSHFDAQLYEFSEEKAKLLRATIKKEQNALTNLQQALSKKDKSQIIKAGVAIKPNFAKIFKMFGRFPS